ncbi:MAG TPA: YncE family protein [Streptosporangiaceae bacterium]|nr:YncE family protein [Streptosporangiaceae bacterium]
MDEPWLHDLLDRATVSEPPIGALALNALRAGIRQRRRRRAQGTVACVAAIALIGTAAVAAARTPGTPPARPASVTGPTTTWVLSGEGNLYAIPNSTKLRGKKILLPGGRQFMAITPNGETIYVSGDEPNAVIPVSAVTHKVGKPIGFGAHYVPTQILITPNGKTAYVTDIQGGEIYPIVTATNTLEKPIRTGPAAGGYYQMAITPDGKTLYAVSSNALFRGRSYVIPIATAANKRGKPIKIQDVSVFSLIMNPDGATVYAIGESTTGTTDIVPISTATNTPGKPVSVSGNAPLAITPNGQILYVVKDSIATMTSGVIPFATATNTPGKQIKIDGWPYAIAVAPDGDTAYAVSQPRQGSGPSCTGQTGLVTPFSTATNRAGRRIRVACDPYTIVVTPDGKTVWVGSRNWVTPISTATDKPGLPLTFRGDLVAIVVGPTP